MPHCLFASDLHGRADRYEKLFRAISERAPDAVFLGGDLLPFPYATHDPTQNLPEDFARDFLASKFEAIRNLMGARYPDVFVILGNDDPRAEEGAFFEGDAAGLWHYCHNRRCKTGVHTIFGYAFVPPSPFQFKDWEKYDVSRYVPPAGVSPEEGQRSVEVDKRAIQFETIAADLESLVENESLDRAVFLFHSPPHETNLDRAATDGRMIDHVPLDLHVGSIAIRRFIERRQPLLTLHGHIHESARITGSWQDRIGSTPVFSAAHDGPELALVSFDLSDLSGATRELL